MHGQAKPPNPTNTDHHRGTHSLFQSLLNHIDHFCFPHHLLHLLLPIQHWPLLVDFGQFGLAQSTALFLSKPYETDP